MELMEIRRRLLNQPKRILVTWNNYQPPFSSANYEPYNPANTSVTDNGGGIITQTWFKAGNGYNFTTRLNVSIPTISTSHKYYVSYMVNPAFDGAYFGVEFGNTGWNLGLLSAEEWTRLSVLTPGGRNGAGRAMWCNVRAGGYYPQPGDTAQIKSPLYVDLTLMFGAGKEPTKEEFERQCRLNKIDLESSHEQDTSGTQRLWYL